MRNARRRRRRASPIPNPYSLIPLLLLLLPFTTLAEEQGVIGFPVGSLDQPAGNVFVRGIASHAWWLDPEIYGDQLFPALDELQVTTVRLSIDWRRFEPQPGVWDWGMYDRVLGELAKRNIVIVANFNTIPGWAATDPESCDTPILEVPTCRLREDMYGAFADAMRAAVERYSWIQHWEFWNEPEMWTHLGNDGPLYHRHLRLFYDIAHEVNPEVVVAAQTLVGYEYMEWLYNISLAEDGPNNQPWDAVSIHPYNFWYVPAPGEPPLEINYDRVQQLRALMIERGDAHKKIWVTEFGWTNEEEWQARNLPIVLDWLQSQPYIEFAHLHMLHDWNDEPHDQFGLMRIVPTPNGYIVLDENTVFEPKELYYEIFKNYPMDLPGRVPPSDEALSFPETGQSIAQPFLDAWRTRGGLDGPGLPLTRPYARKGGDGVWRLVQDFERLRLEHHPERGGGPSAVAGSPVGQEAASSHPDLQAFTPEGACIPSDERLCFTDSEFGIQGGFLGFWLGRDGETLLGLPISNEFVEGGRVVQYFERGRLEWHPEAPPERQVVLGLLVREQLIDQGWLLTDGSPADHDLRLPTRRAFA